MVMDGSILFINEKEAKSLLNMEQTIALMERAFHEYGAGRVVNPVKLHLSLRPDVKGYINSMPSYMVDSNIMGVKLVGVFKENGRQNLPATIGVVTLFNPQDGAPYCIMDGTHITNMRTGAMAGVQAKYLAKKGSRICTLIGTGAQAFTSLEAIQTAIGTLEECRLVDINPAMIEKFTARAKALYPAMKFIPYNTIQEACTGADLIVPCATATKPLLEDIKFDKGATVIIVSEPFRSVEWVRSFDKSVVDFPHCMITRMNQEGQYNGKLSGYAWKDLPMDLFDYELGDIIAGKAKGRENDEQIILTCTVGMSMMDTICGEAIYQSARDQCLGMKLPFMDMEWNKAQ